MTEHSVTHATFSLERKYPASVARVFAAWSDPQAKAQWFAAGVGGPAGGYELDFRVGGREVLRATLEGGQVVTVESRYHDIVPGERIVYTSTLSAGDVLSTVSTTTVEFSVDGDGTRLLLVEQGTFLDGQEEPSWREQGTGDWLDKLGAALQRADVRSE